MTKILRRAALAAATLATAVVSVLSLAGTAEASASAVLVSPKGEATILLDADAAHNFWWTFHTTCDNLTWDLNSKRQNLGMSLGVSTGLCEEIVFSCVKAYWDAGSPNPVLTVYIDATNRYACLY